MSCYLYIMKSLVNLPSTCPTLLVNLVTVDVEAFCFPLMKIIYNSNVMFEMFYHIYMHIHGVFSYIEYTVGQYLHTMLCWLYINEMFRLPTFLILNTSFSDNPLSFWWPSFDKAHYFLHIWAFVSQTYSCCF